MANGQRPFYEEARNKLAELQRVTSGLEDMPKNA